MLILCASLLCHGAFAQAAPSAIGAPLDVVFTKYSPLSAGPELLRRTLSPLANELIRRKLANSGKAMIEQSIDLKREKFVVYVPPHAAPAGYGLMVFVPPWEDARVPRGWAPILDQHGVIFVSAARSGNDANVVARRDPLALLEVKNVTELYSVDPARIWIGGFSGGSRVAMRLALDYPDVFHGAFLHAGSDPMGESLAPLPSKDLFRQFQTSTHLVYVTGAEDTLNLALDAASIASMRKWCVSDIEATTTPFAGHDADPRALAQALESLNHPVPPEGKNLGACREAVEARLAQKLQRAQSLIAEGKRQAARRLLFEIDASFGGLAVPRVLELARKCGCGIF